MPELKDGRVELIGEIPSPRAKMNKAKRKRNRKLKSYKEADDEFKIAQLEFNIYECDRLLKWAVLEDDKDEDEEKESCETIEMLAQTKQMLLKRKIKLKKRH